MDSIFHLSQHIARTSFRDLPAHTVENTKKFIMDTIGVGIAGVNAPGCGEALEVVKQWGGRPESTVILKGFKCPAPWASFVNSIAMHALDFDDALDESAHHANVSAFPAALAVAEAQGGLSGKDLICALALGQDISCRLALSLRRPLAWTRAATCGYFGATAAAGKLLGLDEEQMRNAFGIVYSQTAGNVQGLVDGALSKRMQPGFAAKSAVLSVELALRGITGATNVLEGDFGFFKLYEGNDYERDILLKGLGKEFAGDRLSLKAYPSCRMTHSAIDLAIQLGNDNRIRMDEIAKINVTCSSMVHTMVGKPFEMRDTPQTDAQFSIPYCVATALNRGDVFLEDFDEQCVRESSKNELINLVEVHPDPNLSSKDMMSCRMEIVTRSGGSFSADTDAAKGNPVNPMTLKECVEKFKKCAANGKEPMDETRVSSILDMLANLEDIDDCRMLTQLLS